MSQNIDRFKKDLDNLVEQAVALNTGLVLDAFGRQEAVDGYKKAGYSDKDIEILLKGSLNFRNNYESWYSESHALIKQILPDRLKDFISHYEIPRGRKDLNWGNYVIKDALLGSVVSNTVTKEVLVNAKAALAHLQNQISIVRAAKARFQSSLFEIRQIVQADLFDSELDAARELLRNGFTRAAGAIAGVVLEKHLAQVCADHSIDVRKKNPGIADLNEALKSGSVIALPVWRHVSMLGDLRNLCDHKKATEPTVDQVQDLVDGTDKILRTVS